MFKLIANLTEGERWLYGIIATVILSLVGILVNQRLNHVLAVRRERLKTLIEKSAQFRSIISIERIEKFREYHLLTALHDGLVPGEGEKFDGEYFKLIFNS